jgi:hypothetical protein
MSFLTIARAEHAEQHGRLLRAVAGIPEPAAEPEGESSETVPFDGGARQTPARAITHAETLSALLASRMAHLAEFPD